MSKAHLALLAIAIPAAPGLLWGAFMLWLQWQAARLRRDLQRAGEEVLAGPESAHYQGSTGERAMVRTLGVIALTHRRLVFRTPFGIGIELALAEITSVKDSKWFQGGYRGGRRFLIVRIADGSEFAFAVRHHRRWMRELFASISTGPEGRDHPTGDTAQT
jgi:hypothetical protein